MTDEASAELGRIRTEIEGIDRDIVALVARRLDLCREVAPLKAAAGLEAHLPHRVQLVVDRWTSAAADRGISPKLMRSLCEQIIAEGERLQTEVMAASNVSIDHFPNPDLT